jgi:sigma-E factor negative regulatory protein RseC
VVRVENGVAWFEPEQTTSCGHCASSALCGAGSGGIGSIAKRMELRHFPMTNTHDLAIGERVVLGVDERSLLKASLAAYMLPLLTALVAGGIAHGMAGDDLTTMLAMFGGLFAGLLLSAVAAHRLETRGELSPQFLRRAGHSGATQ